MTDPRLFPTSRRIPPLSKPHPPHGVLRPSGRVARLPHLISDFPFRRLLRIPAAPIPRPRPTSSSCLSPPPPRPSAVRGARPFPPSPLSAVPRGYVPTSPTRTCLSARAYADVSPRYFIRCLSPPLLPPPPPPSNPGFRAHFVLLLWYCIVSVIRKLSALIY